VEAPPVDPPAEDELPPASEPEPDPAPAPPVDPTPPIVPDPAPAPPANPPPTPPSVQPQIDAGFEAGWRNWNIGGVGEVLPTLVNDVVRDGSTAAAVVLTDSQNRSELTLGGNGGKTGTIDFSEGSERFYGFSFNVREMTYGRAGAHNLIMQLKSDGEGSPALGLQLWDYQGKRGLWSHGSAMGGDRYLAPIPHGAWQDIVLRFKASSQGAGSYELYLNGVLLDARGGVSTIVPGRSTVYIKNGLYRNGLAIPGRSDIRLDAARLGSTFAEASIR
jgi:hypothetical protein